MSFFPPSDYLDLSHTIHGQLFPESEPVWAAVGKIKAYLADTLKPGNHGRVVHEGKPGGAAFIGENVFIDEGTTIMPGAIILGPAWIGKNCTIVPGAYIRENVIIGDHCIVGNSSEFKNCVLFDRCEIPHFNYVGDSILGYKAHLGAGAILSNWRLDHAKITIPAPDQPGGRIETGLEKFGAVLGDNVDVGSNSVISPGSLLGRRSLLYPGAHWRGILPEDRIVKVRQQTQLVERRAVNG